MLNNNVKKTIEKIKTTDSSSAEQGEENTSAKTQADKLIEIASNSNITFFQDQFGEPFVRIEINGHMEICKVKGRQFKRWLSHEMWKKEKKAPSSTALTSAMNILESKACHDGETIELGNRILKQNKIIWYDLADKNWRVVKVTNNSWNITENSPVHFRRYSHQKEQIDPVINGNIEEVLKFVHMTEPGQNLLFLVYLISCFIPDIPHPIIVFYGPQGASKTTVARLLRSLIDPSGIEVLTMPSNANDLIQLLAHNWFAFFDNLTYMPDWLSDVFCRAVTGAGFLKRELYTDDDDIIYSFRRCIGMNGINLVIRKSDLLDRSILFKLDRIPQEKRRTEGELWTEFNKVKPSILGGIFETLAKTMSLIDKVKLEQKPRMADFAQWGCAIAEALGYSQQEFLEAYNWNIDSQHNEAIQENLVAMAVMAFMEKQDRIWEGTASELLLALNTVALNETFDLHGRSWPKAPNILTRRLNEVKTNLNEIGIRVDTEKISNGRRKVKLEKVTKIPL